MLDTCQSGYPSAAEVLGSDTHEVLERVSIKIGEDGRKSYKWEQRGVLNGIPEIEVG